MDEPRDHPIALGVRAAFAAPVRPECREVRTRFQRGGVARDAREKSFGRLKIDETVDGTFTEEEDRVTWWGEFDRSFSYWGEPRLESKFYDPSGEVAFSKKFTSEHCKLAKVAMPLTPDQVRAKPGTWRVETRCEKGDPLDTQTFEVRSSQDTRDEAGRVRIVVEDLD